MDRLHETATILTTLNRISLSWRFFFAKISIFFENSYSCCLFFLVFLSLNRTFDLTVLGTHVRKHSNKFGVSLT